MSESTRTVAEGAVPVHQLFPRESCVECLDASPVCPECPSGQSCQVTVPLTCTECPRSYCAANAATPTSSASSSSNTRPSTGAIAGGVIGGVAAIALITYLVWRFCIKTKRQRVPVTEPMDENSVEAGDGMSFSTRRGARSSVHTAHSIASTVLTRASNIIQIAYIPGVMNRATPTSPTVLVPPVPPIPIAVSSASQPSTPGDEHFFVPGDLRDSTYSGYSGYSDRTSVARTSYAPRSSIASTIYGKNAVVLAPPQTGMRIKPTMVNLKPGSSSNPSPPVPSIDYEKYNNRRVSDANSTFSVGSTFLNNASAAVPAVPARPVIVRVGSNRKKPSNLGTSNVLNADTINEKDPKSAEKDADKGSLISPVNEKAPASPASPSKQSSVARDSNAITLIDDSPAPEQSPFSDPPVRASQRTTTSLNTVIEEATRRASAKDTNQTTDRGRSPFGDEHATDDN